MKKNNIFVLIPITGIVVVGLAIFMKGFMLKRVVVGDNSTCVRDVNVNGIKIRNTTSNSMNQHCWSYRHFNKCVILIIDALRYDFLQYNANLTSHYSNKLPIIAQLLQTKPHNSVVYRFVADPPTTTLQRLKGITTGSLPTFIDAGSNFATSEINEDNIIDQLVRNGRQVIMMGDDTWIDLFPGRFHKSHPYPSFNVHDLHTVDNGVLKHLVPTLKSKDWDVVIAHFLGVDHCGHRFGSDHPAMAEKLRQMNKMIGSVIDSVDDNTVVMVMGDHGMTATGDHGGDSRDELEAGLFVYANKQLLTDSVQHESTVRQTDIVPTLAQLLGFPIPFSNLGRVITDLFPVCKSCSTPEQKVHQHLYTTLVLQLNAEQITRYIDAYMAMSSDISAATYDDLKMRYRELDMEFHLLSHLANDELEMEDSKLRLVALSQAYRDYMEDIRNVCEKVWAKFDIGLMVVGIVIVVSVVCVSLRLLLTMKRGISSITRVVILQCVTTLLSLYVVVMVDVSSCAAIFYSISAAENIALIIYTVYGSVGSSLRQFYSSYSLQNNFDDGLSFFVISVSFVSHFSNSFVVYQDIVTLYLTQTLIFSKILTIFRLNLKGDQQTKKKHSKLKHTFDLLSVITKPMSLALLACFCLCICIRSLQYFFICREEQTNCISYNLTVPTTSLITPTPTLRSSRIFLSISSLVLLISLPTIWLRNRGNMNGSGVFQLCVRYFFPICGVCISLYWVLQTRTAPVLDSLPPWQITMFPRIVFVLLAISFILHVISPISVYMVDRKKSTKSIDTPGATTVPALYRHLKSMYMRKSEDNSIPLAYGLHTVYTSSLVYLVTLVSILLTLLLGEGASASLTVLLVSQYLLLEVHSYIVNLTKDYAVPISLVVLSTLFSRLMFYSTGHQTTFVSVRWEAAYIGFHGDHTNNIVPAILIAANTFASYIVTAVMAPLIVMWPRIGGRIFYAFTKKREDNGQDDGDFRLYSNAHDLWSGLVKVSVATVVVHSIHVMGAMLGALVLRRHLMVWKVFAQVLLFEAIGVVVVLLCIRLHCAAGTGCNAWSPGVTASLDGVEGVCSGVAV